MSLDIKPRAESSRALVATPKSPVETQNLLEERMLELKKKLEQVQVEFRQFFNVDCLG